MQSEKMDLPNILPLPELVQSRGKEIQVLTKLICATSGTKLIFQKIPKHMRRRIMSHNPKRMPRRLREGHISQMRKSGMPPKTKRPSRKYRRRPSNLLNEYKRRKRRIKWLETHIWHAKRFKIIEKWGFKIPYHPCDKSFRALYRATTQHCLIQDLSYYGCIEISGDEQDLVNGFAHLTNTSSGLTINAKAFRDGTREGCCVLYHKNKFPYKPIGKIQFVWKKPHEDDETYRTIWIWCHPSFYVEASDAIKKVFALEESVTEVKTKEPKCFKNKNETIVLRELMQYLNRFRLTGPLSHAVLINSVKLPSLENKTEWFSNALQHKPFFDTVSEQIFFWKTLSKIVSHTQLPPSCVLNLHVVDPRYQIPVKRTKASTSKENASPIFNLPNSITDGKIWDAQICKEASKKRPKSVQMPNKQLVSLSGEEYINGFVLPVMLIQRPGLKDDNLGFGSGWDIIFPAGWAMSFWIAMIFWGARAGGSRESESIAFEMLTHYAAADTAAGKLEDEENKQERIKQYFQKPPKNRVNYIVNKINYPFSFPWLKLVNEWCDAEYEDFFVLRDKQQLIALQEILKHKTLSSFPKNISENCLIPVKVKYIAKGAPKPFALICFPEGDEKPPITESPRKDLNKEKRKILRKSHSLYLKKAKNARRKAKCDETKVSTRKIIPTKSACEIYRREIQKLWLPQEDDTVRNSCSREVLGLISSGGFSYLRAMGCGVGYIPLNALRKLVTCKMKSVLIRNISTLYYDLAKLEIIDLVN